MDRYYLAALKGVECLSIIRLKKMLQYFGKAENLWHAKLQELINSKIIETAIAENIVRYCQNTDILKFKELLNEKKICICTIEDEEYPFLLKKIYMPPMVFFYQGDIGILNQKLCLGMVGARKASLYGKNVAEKLAGELAENGLAIVSGAARGIDTAAHKGAMFVNEGKTVAVLGCGVDVTYPPENKKLLEEIREKGLLLSEYLPGAKPKGYFFPMRNRIISGLSKGVIVVEAARKSGSLITADFALEQGRDVFAVPGSIFAETYRGTHNLIKQGAKIVTDVQDVLEEYDLTKVVKNKGQIDYLLKGKLSKDENLVYCQLSDLIPKDIEELAVLLGIKVQNIAVILLNLQIKGLVMEVSGKKYILNNNR